MKRRSFLKGLVAVAGSATALTKLSKEDGITKASEALREELPKIATQYKPSRFTLTVTM